MQLRAREAAAGNAGPTSAAADAIAADSSGFAAALLRVQLAFEAVDKRALVPLTLMNAFPVCMAGLQCARQLGAETCLGMLCLHTGYLLLLAYLL